jgi:hypothetical protein
MAPDLVAVDLEPLKLSQVGQQAGGNGGKVVVVEARRVWGVGAVCGGNHAKSNIHLK